MNEAKSHLIKTLEDIQECAESQVKLLSGKFAAAPYAVIAQMAQRAIERDLKS